MQSSFSPLLQTHIKIYWVNIGRGKRELQVFFWVFMMSCQNKYQLSWDIISTENFITVRKLWTSFEDDQFQYNTSKFLTMKAIKRWHGVSISYLSQDGSRYVQSSVTEMSAAGENIFTHHFLLTSPLRYKPDRPVLQFSYSFNVLMLNFSKLPLVQILTCHVTLCTELHTM